MNVPIAPRIKGLREGLRLTQRQLAAKLQVAHNTVSQYENGTIYPSLGMVVELAQIFDVTTDYLLGADKEYAMKG